MSQREFTEKTLALSQVWLKLKATFIEIHFNFHWKSFLFSLKVDLIFIESRFNFHWNSRRVAPWLNAGFTRGAREREFSYAAKRGVWRVRRGGAASVWCFNFPTLSYNKVSIPNPKTPKNTPSHLFSLHTPSQKVYTDELWKRYLLFWWPYS